MEGRRDWGYAPEYVEAMWKILQQDRPDDYVIGTGKLHSVRDLLKIAFDHFGLDYQNHVVINKTLNRPSEETNLCADSRKAKKELNWESRTSFKRLIVLLVEAELRALT